MQKYKKIKIIEIVLNGVKGKEIESNSEIEFYHKNIFLNYSNIKREDEIVLCFDKKRKYYNQIGVIFDTNYIKENFKIGNVDNAVIVKKMGNIYIFSTLDKRYGKIYEDEMVEKDSEYKIGDGILVSLTKFNKFSIYEANMTLYKKAVDIKNGYYKFKIKKIAKFENIKKTFLAYTFFTEEGLKIFTPYRNRDLFDKNYDFFRAKIIEENTIEIGFDYFKSRDFFNFSVEKNLLSSDEENYAELKKHEINNNYYIKTTKGFCELYIEMMSYIEKTILKNLVGRYIKYEIKEMRYSKDKLNTVLGKFDRKFILESKNKELENKKIIDVINTNIDKKMYIIDLGNRVIGILEESEYSYDNSIGKIDEVLEKVQIKDILGGYYIFLTRKPYLIDPKKEFFDGKKNGEIILGKIKRNYEYFVTVTFNEQFDIPILKENLKPLDFFSIDEFYDEGKIYEFYVEKVEDRINLWGYNKAKHIEKLKNYMVGSQYKGKIYKKMVTKYIIRLENELEAELPIEEISYFNEEIQFDENKAYEFQLINKTKNGNSWEETLYLSRKRLSSLVYSYSRNYKVGDETSGSFFYKDENGYYVTLQYKGQDIPETVGFLKNEEISLYPDLEEFEKEILNKTINFKIKKIPNNIRKNSYLKEKAILISIKDFSSFDLEKYYYSLYENELYFNENSLIKNGLKYKNKENRIYFEKYENKQKVIFGLKSTEIIPGIIFQGNLIEEYLDFFDNIKTIAANETLGINEKKLLKILYNVQNYDEILKQDFLLKNLKKEYLNLYNNTIEVNYSEYIFEMLKENFEKSEITILEENNEKFGYFLDEKRIKIKIHFNNRNFIVGKKYEIVLSDFIKSENKIIADIVQIKSDSIGEKFPLKILSKKCDKRYRVIVFDKIIGEVTIGNEYEVYKGEDIYGELKSFENNNPIFDYKSLLKKENLVKINQYSIDNIYKFIRNELNLKELTQNEIYIIYDELYKKIDKINSTNCKLDKVEINKIKEILDNGFRRENYFFEENNFASGNFGEIFKGIDLLKSKEVICKRYISNREEDFEKRKFEVEAKTLMELDIEGIPKVYKYLEDKNECIEDYIEGGTFGEFLKKNKEKEYNEKKDEYLKIFIKMAERLDELSMEIDAHCDIKPANIIYNEKEKNIHIIDFGSIQTKEEKGGFGTLFYASPLQCKIYSNPHTHFTEEHNFGEKQDIYSFGVMMYEAFVGQLPYGSELEERILITAHQYGQIDEGTEYSFVNPSVLNNEVSKELEDIILKCMNYNINERYNDFSEIIMDLEEI